MTGSFDPMKPGARANYLASAAVLLATIALLIASWNWVVAPTVNPERALQDRFATIRKAGTLRVGYGGYPPYTIAGTSNVPPTGFSVDLVKAIAGRTSPPLRVDWNQFSFDTMKADLQADRFDFIADPVFMTIARAEDFAFTRPYSYFGIAVGLVRAGDTRFKSFTDLDQAGITIVLAEGWTSSEYARAHLSKPTLKSVPVTGDATTQLDEVLAGRADIALNDVPTVLQYVHAHPGKVEALWLNSPPSSVAGAFVLRQGDDNLRNFLDSSIVILQADGTIDSIDKKWHSLGFFPKVTLKPGAGIAGTSAATPTTNR